MSKMNDPDSGMPEPVKDDPYAELFADCSTVEEVMALQAEIDLAWRNKDGDVIVGQHKTESDR